MGTDPFVDACVKACNDLGLSEGITDPREAALYQRLVIRMMEAMRAACMTEHQMDVVIDAFYEGARELYADTLNGMQARQRAEHFERARAIMDRDRELLARLQDTPQPHIAPSVEVDDVDDEEPLIEPKLVEVEVKCGACQRSLGTATVPDYMAAAAPPEGVRCPGCVREGR
jgi:hypothetical protein